MRIDAHMHCWRLAGRSAGFPSPDMTAIYRDVLPDELVPVLARHRVGKTVMVQSEASEADTAFMLELAARYDFIGAVIGWTDLKHPNAPQRIAAMARNPVLRGLRPMLQDIVDDEWIDDEQLAPAVAAMLRHGLSFDALVLPRHLRALLAFATRFPDLPIVIDHAAKPLIAQGQTMPWRQDLEQLARLPQMHCKLSGLVTEAGAQWSCAQLKCYVETVLDAFGPQRVMWGSDWPVLDMAADYSAWLATCEELLAGLDQADRLAIFGGTAARFYRLEQAAGSTIPNQQ